MDTKLANQKFSNNLPLSDQTGNLELTMKLLKQKYQQLWLETEMTFPEFLESYPSKRKKEIEQETTIFLNRLTKKQQHQEFNHTQGFEGVLKKEEHDIEKLCNLAGLYIDKQFSEGFDRSTKIFMKKAKQFDPSLKPENIYQAMRNVWIMNSLQILMNLDMYCSNSMFAYSMLYPYSDNINDDVVKSIDAKFRMNRNFKAWLEGNSCPYQNETERKIYLLIKMIEEEFPRDKYPEVFQSLLSIYNAQIKSLIQQKQNSNPHKVDILDISLEKGGTSVLADGYLINGIMDKNQEDFCFGYGAFLQFADDIQDVCIDKENSHSTLFSQMADNNYLDELANKLFNFMLKVVNLHLSDTAYNRLRTLIVENCNFMVLGAIGKNRQLYSPKYIKAIEIHFPFTFPYFKIAKKRLKQMLLKANPDSFNN